MTPHDALLPDELIRSRNWAELTEEEKASLKEVAATEEEFRLLKMMLVTTAQTEAIPVLSPAVHQRLKTVFQTEHQRHAPVRWWHYAAAAAVLTAIAGTVWIVASKNKTEPPLVRQEQQIFPSVEVVKDSNKTIQPVITREIKPEVQETAQKKIVVPVPKVPGNQPKIIPPVPPKNIPVMNPEPALAINTSLKENSDLLQLVVAVY